jgi:hypothetical protein
MTHSKLASYQVLGLVAVQERCRREQRSLTNIVRSGCAGEGFSRISGLEVDICIGRRESAR